MYRIGAIVCIALIGMPFVAAQASPGQATTPSGNAFVSACAGNGFGGVGETGNAISGGTSFSIGSPPAVEAQNCFSQQSATSGGSATTGTVSGSGATYGHTFNNSATATAAPGTIHLSASNNADAATQFSGAAAQGGWNDTIIPVGGAVGTQGILPVKLAVTGALTATGPGSDGSAYLSVQLYENQAYLQPYGSALSQTAYNKFVAKNSAFDPTTNIVEVGEGDVLFSWGYQMKPYAVRWDQGDSGTQTSLPVNETVWFFLPITWGTAVEIGTYGLVQAGEAAYGASTGPNTAVSNFIDTVSWDGVGAPLSADGTPSGITNFSLFSPTTGLNYAQSLAVPEPAGLAVLATGIGGLARARRYRGWPDAISEIG